MLVDLRPFDAELTGKDAQIVLDEAGITLNKNTIPDDPRSPFVTSRPAHRHPVGHHAGHGTRRWPTSVRLIARVLRGRDDAAVVAAVRDEVANLCAKFTPYPQS